MVSVDVCRGADAFLRETSRRAFCSRPGELAGAPTGKISRHSKESSVLALSLLRRVGVLNLSQAIPHPRLLALVDLTMIHREDCLPATPFISSPDSFSIVNCLNPSTTVVDDDNNNCTDDATRAEREGRQVHSDENQRLRSQVLRPCHSCRWRKANRTSAGSNVNGTPRQHIFTHSLRLG
ncbi:hypothetical protein BGZ60DRAFT_278060 [Tricladium varicosporioides]|nr:hypothetical protein BGZ60DRAFT_278060 [Hymenoscyphus varicosporioides]